MPYPLTRDAVYAAARRAYEERRLTAQHPSEDLRCVYEDARGYRCAVGAALSDEAIAELRRSNFMSTDFRSLVGRLFDVPSDDVYDISKLQSVHDEWTKHPDAEALFRDFLYR